MHLIQQLKENKVINYGNFTLKSGQSSDIYFNFKSLTHYPKLFTDICYQLSKLVTQNGAMAGVPVAGIPFATLVSNILVRPMILVRNEKKEYGMQQQVEGDYNECVVIEDVVTTGISVLNTINILNEHNIKVTQIICLCDRQAGGVDKLKHSGYQVNCLYQLQDFFIEQPTVLLPQCDTVTKLLQITQEKQTNVIASLDCDNIYNIIDVIGQHICGIKIHGDIYQQLDIDRINFLKQKYNFLVIEDRKLSDITSICIKQVNLIKRHADIVTVHGLCGNTMIQTVSQVLPIIIVCNMSNKDNLIDQIYVNKTLDIKCENLVGYVSQYKIQNYLTFTPGININKNSDMFDQTYHNPLDRECDYYIIGRGIYEGNVLQNVLMYKQLCYKND
jgi:uridine monophosphate synthetase